MDRKEYVARIVAAIRETHRVEVIHSDTVPVEEKFRGKIIWKGEVEVFDTVRHPKAQKIYAWGHLNDFSPSKLEITMVLSIKPVDTPQKAVRAAVRQEAKQMTAN